MKVINFSHPLTTGQLEELNLLLGDGVISEVIEVKVQIDHGRSVIDQSRKLVNDVGWSPLQWQGTPFMINLPGLSVVAASVLSEVHGRCGYFPAILRLAPIPSMTPPKFAVAEVVNLQQQRDESRCCR